MPNEGQQAATTPPKPEPKKQTSRRKRQRRELRVAFDTNVLFTGSSSDLVRQEATNLIQQSKFPDLEIQWYLPEVVRLERQFQMQKGALELLAPLARVEKLLGHNLNISEDILIERVEKVIAQRQKELGLITLKPEYASLDWERLVLDSAFRRAPFQDGKTEKGFRDAIVTESFMHLANISPKTPKVCRVVLVTADALVGDALRVRTAGLLNVAVIGSLEELRGFINTLVSEVDEAFIGPLRPKAEKLFFALKDESTLYYKESIRDRLSEKFSAELAAVPAGATNRKNGTWRISTPNFSKKSGQRIQWASRIEIETEATKIVQHEDRTILSDKQAIHFLTWREPESSMVVGRSWPKSSVQFPLLEPSNFMVSEHLQSPIAIPSSSVRYSLSDCLQSGSTSTVTTHKGTDVYDILWSVEVTTALDLRRPSIEDMLHIATNWDAVA